MLKKKVVNEVEEEESEEMSVGRLSIYSDSISSRVKLQDYNLIKSLNQISKINQNLQIFNHFTKPTTTTTTLHEPTKPIGQNYQATLHHSSHLDSHFKDLNTNSKITSLPTASPSNRTSNLTGEVDDCDKLNPLVLHHAKIQLQTWIPPIQPYILKSKSKKSKSKSKSHSKVKSGQIHLDSNFCQVHHSIYLSIPELFDLINTRKPAIPSMCFESVNAIISTNYHQQSDLNMNLSKLTSPETPTRTNNIQVGNLNPTQSISQTIKKLKCIDFLEVFKPKAPNLRLRDVISRISFRFNETHSCELDCRKVMIMISKSYQTLPPGSMKPIKIGNIVVKAPLPLIRHEACDLRIRPLIGLEWTDGTWESFDPTGLTVHQILGKCYFHALDGLGPDSEPT